MSPYRALWICWLRLAGEAPITDRIFAPAPSGAARLFGTAATGTPRLFGSAPSGTTRVFKE